MKNLDFNQRQHYLLIRIGETTLQHAWIQIDLGQMMRVTKLLVDTPASQRAPKRIRVDYSSTGINFVR